ASAGEPGPTMVKHCWRARVLALVSGLMMTSGSAALRAQDLPPAQVDATPGQSTTGSQVPQLSRLYGGMEYLGWWVKGAPLSVPLVSTGPISTTHHGWLSSPDSTILYGAPFGVAQGGNSTQPFSMFSGGRLTL